MSKRYLDDSKDQVIDLAAGNKQSRVTVRGGVLGPFSFNELRDVRQALQSYLNDANEDGKDSARTVDKFDQWLKTVIETGQVN